MRALLIANTGDADAGYVGSRFADFDFEFRHLPREYPAQWPTLDGIDLVLLLGSEWSVYWGDMSKSVQAESELIGETHRRGIPLFGICYGAQIMASALGGSAERAKKCEIGWHEVVTTPTYALLGGLWLQWHCDTFTPPPGAEVLALSDAGPQALRIGRSFATQYAMDEWNRCGRTRRPRDNAINPDGTDSSRSCSKRTRGGKGRGLVLAQCRKHSNVKGGRFFTPQAQVVVLIADVPLSSVVSHGGMVWNGRSSCGWTFALDFVPSPACETFSREITHL